MMVPCSLTMAMYVPGTEGVARGAEQLGADHHGEEAAGEEEQEDADGVLPADHLVVLGHAEVADPALPGGGGRELVAEDLGQRIVECADAGQPADHAQDETEHDGDVVLGVLCTWS